MSETSRKLDWEAVEVARLILSSRQPRVITPEEPRTIDEEVDRLANHSRHFVRRLGENAMASEVEPPQQA